MSRYVVSACLLGENCKYSGGNNRCEELIDFISGKEYICVCPEVEGGLPVPREPAERLGDTVVTASGGIVTAEFIRGAEKCCQRAIEFGADKAILKSKSPSCGKGFIYDGTFSGKLTEGNGVFAEILIQNGLEVINENQNYDF